VGRERRRRGSIAGAVALAIIGAFVASPVASAFASDRHVAFGEGLLLLALVLLVPAYALTAWMGRDADRLVDRLSERRRRAAALEARLATTPLPFDCDEDTFAAVVERELTELPVWVQNALRREGTRIEVADQLDGNPLVLGLFSRRPVPGPALVGGGSRVDSETAITLYRLPLIRAAGFPRNLAVQLRETLLHEVGHLVGMSEADLDRYSIGNQPRPDATVVRPRD
jgi:predicted Zn-dependent protease with MMP-like domain